MKIIRGKGYWKFNNSLLKDRKYVDTIKNVIEEVKQTYSTNIRPDENTPNQNLQFNINDQLFLETLLMIIRGNTIKFSSIKKKENEREEQNLEHDIKEIENEINTNFLNIEDEKLNTLVQKKQRLTEIRKTKIEGVMLRSRVRYEDLGEKPTKYFLNLENRQFTNKVMNKIIEENGNEFTDTQDILNSQKRFYQTLYDEVNKIDDVPIENILGQNENPLSQQEAEKLEGEIEMDELTKALKNMKNDKSPGPDGFTAEFFKFFFIDIGIFVLRSLNYAYRTGQLSVTQKQGVKNVFTKTK